MHFAKVPAEVGPLAEAMIGGVLVTKQTGEAGAPVDKVRARASDTLTGGL